MKIDPTMAQKPQQILPQQVRNGDKDGDKDDIQKMSKTPQANQIQDTEAGNKIDIFA